MLKIETKILPARFILLCLWDGGNAHRRFEFPLCGYFDLTPGWHRRKELSATLQQIVPIMDGVLTIYIADSTLH